MELFILTLSHLNTQDEGPKKGIKLQRTLQYFKTNTVNLVIFLQIEDDIIVYLIFNALDKKKSNSLNCCQCIANSMVNFTYLRGVTLSLSE